MIPVLAWLMYTLSFAGLKARSRGDFFIGMVAITESALTKVINENGPKNATKIRPIDNTPII
jgi:hypothetical protein